MRASLLLLLALSACAYPSASLVGYSKSWTGDPVATTIVAAEIAIGIAAAEDRAEPWCEVGEIDPPHTCPKKAGELPR